MGHAWEQPTQKAGGKRGVVPHSTKAAIAEGLITTWRVGVRSQTTVIIGMFTHVKALRTAVR